MAAVVAYHLGHLSGGFLGVDLFFVLSGFLITSLLLREQERTGRISLRRFWERRARRLLPALGATLVGVVVAARLFLDHDRLPALRWDALTTAAYVANWRFALAPTAGYFAPDPSPLRHTWSLAIEEQYYVVWPLVVVGVMALARRRGGLSAAAVGAVAGAGVVASTAWMALHAGSWSIDRLYLGTDTRVLAPLLGALLACVLHRRPVPDRAAAPGRGPTVLTAGAVAVLAVAVVAVDATDPWMYRGGFLLAAGAAAAAVAGGVLDPTGPMARALAVRPLRWLGERSYGLYLYSWPLQVVLEAQGLTGWALAGTTVGASLLLAEASHRWLEMPVRQGGTPSVAGPAATPGAATPGAATPGSGPPAPPPPARPGWRPGALATVVTLAVVAVVVAGTVTDARPDPLATRSQEQFAADATRPALTVPPDDVAPAGAVRALVVGDSVGFTLGEYAPDDLPGVASVDARALPGCSLLTGGARPPDAVAVGAPDSYDDCAEPVAEADRLGLEGRPDVVLLVTGAWESSEHERDGRTVGPGDEAWTAELRDLLAARIDRLAGDGAAVALWADACGRTPAERERQDWYATEVLEPVAEADDRATVVRPATVACRGDRAITDVPAVGDPRPDDGQHWSEEGAAWLWRTWLGPELQGLVARPDPGGEPAPEGDTEGDAESGEPGSGEAAGPVRTMVVGDSIAFTLDYRGHLGATDAGIELVPGVGRIGCGLVRTGRSADGGRDLASECGDISADEDLRRDEGRPEVVLAQWGAWEMAGVSAVPAAGRGVPDDPAYDALVRRLLRERLEALGATGARVALLAVDCWPPVAESRAPERVRWWRDLSRAVAAEVGAAYLDPTEVLCADGEARRDVPGVGDPRPEDGAHWTEAGAEWFWREWLGPQVRRVAADG